MSDAPKLTAAQLAERRAYALTCARLRMMPGKDRTILTTEAVDAVCAELLAYEEREKALMHDSAAYLDWLERGGKQP